MFAGGAAAAAENGSIIDTVELSIMISISSAKRTFAPVGVGVRVGLGLELGLALGLSPAGAEAEGVEAPLSLGDAAGCAFCPHDASMDKHRIREITKAIHLLVLFIFFYPFNTILVSEC